MYSTDRLQRDMARYVSMSDQELMQQVSNAHDVMQSATAPRHLEVGRRALAHIEFEVLMRLEDNRGASAEDCY